MKNKYSIWIIMLLMVCNYSFAGNEDQLQVISKDTIMIGSDTLTRDDDDECFYFTKEISITSFEKNRDSGIDSVVINDLTFKFGKKKKTTDILLHIKKDSKYSIRVGEDKFEISTFKKPDKWDLHFCKDSLMLIKGDTLKRYKVEGEFYFSYPLEDDSVNINSIGRDVMFKYMATFSMKYKNHQYSIDGKAKQFLNKNHLGSSCFIYPNDTIEINWGNEIYHIVTTKNNEYSNLTIIILIFLVVVMSFIGIIVGYCWHERNNLKNRKRSKDNQNKGEQSDNQAQDGKNGPKVDDPNVEERKFVDQEKLASEGTQDESKVGSVKNDDPQLKKLAQIVFGEKENKDSGDDTFKKLEDFLGNITGLKKTVNASDKKLGSELKKCKTLNDLVKILVAQMEKFRSLNEITKNPTADEEKILSVYVLDFLKKHFSGRMDFDNKSVEDLLKELVEMFDFQKNDKQENQTTVLLKDLQEKAKSKSETVENILEDFFDAKFKSMLGDNSTPKGLKEILDQNTNIEDLLSKFDDCALSDLPDKIEKKLISGLIDKWSNAFEEESESSVDNDEVESVKQKFSSVCNKDDLDDAVCSLFADNKNKGVLISAQKKLLEEKDGKIKQFFKEYINLTQELFNGVEEYVDKAYPIEDETHLSLRIQRIIHNDSIGLKSFSNSLKNIISDEQELDIEKTKDKMKQLFNECLQSPSWIDVLTQLYLYVQEPVIAEKLQDDGLDISAVNHAFLWTEKMMNLLGFQINYPRLFRDTMNPDLYIEQPLSEIGDVFDKVPDLVGNRRNLLIDLYRIGYKDIDGNDHKAEVSKFN